MVEYNDILNTNTLIATVSLGLIIGVGSLSYFARHDNDVMKSIVKKTRYKFTSRENPLLPSGLLNFTPVGGKSRRTKIR
jgi:hypothetical protein